MLTAPINPHIKSKAYGQGIGKTAAKNILLVENGSVTHE